MYADALTKVMVALALIAITSSKSYSPPAGRIGRVATLAQRAPSGTARGLALAMLASTPTGAHAARLQLDFGEWVIFDQLAVGWRGLAGEYLLVILAALVLTLGIWLFCQYRFLYALQSTSRDHWQSLVSLYGQSASQHRPYLESSSTDDEMQTFPGPVRVLRHRHPRKTYKMPNIQENGSQTMGSDYVRVPAHPMHTDEHRRLGASGPPGCTLSVVSCQYDGASSCSILTAFSCNASRGTSSIASRTSTCPSGKADHSTTN